MAWAAVSWFSVGLIVKLVERIIEEKYRKVFVTRSILQCKLCFLQDMEFSRMKMLLLMRQDLFNHGLMNTRIESWPSQSPNLNVLNPL